MSAILHNPDRQDPEGSLGADGVRRYKTRCKILLDSHTNSETLTLIEDVVSVQTSKTIKGPGQAAFTLTPSENYLNLIFPNDYVNIYFDIGDGAGWTRTFFGMVDRVEEEYVVAGDGKPRTLYQVVCGDFFKVVEKTVIYFNPHMQQREDFQNFDLAQYNIAGLTLMSKGIVAGGSPTDILQNLLSQLLGFGTQFQLPASYSPGSTQKALRDRRVEEVTGKWNVDARENFASLGNNVNALKAQVNDQVKATVEKFGKLSSIEDQRKAVAEELGIELRVVEGKEAIATEAQLIKEASDAKLREAVSSAEGKRGLIGSLAGDAERNLHLLESSVAEQSTMLDVLDIYTFVERRAIDGFLFGAPVWQKEGPLISILRAFSNEPINEMFFDLRPLSSAGSDNELATRPIDGSYSFIADDKNGNRDEGDGSVAGVTYIPAVVMREYPFSTVKGIDLSEVELQLDRNDDDKEKVGYLEFGAIFSDKPNVPGRHVISINNINVDDIGKDAAESAKTGKEVKGRSSVKGYKHLDVAVISEKEIVKSTLGRSDADHYNLFEFWSDAVLGQDMKFYMRDILPIITPIHILRNGLRVRTVTTRAARFSIGSVRARRTTDPKPKEKKDPANQTRSAVQDLSPLSALGLPIDPDTQVMGYYGSDQEDWGYRPKPNPKRKAGKNPLNKWVFHQGIDISKKLEKFVPAEKWPLEIPILAIADGWIIQTVPDSGKAGYGNYVVIKHNFQNFGIEGFRYSTYAHLSRFEPRRLVGLGKGVFMQTTPASVPSFSAEGETPGVRKGLQKPIPVEKGDIIGYMGNTGFEAAPGTRFHLHFEINRRVPPRWDAITPRKDFSEFPQDGAGPPIPAAFDQTGTNTATMRAANQKSCDPIQFYFKFGIDLRRELNAKTSPPTPPPADIETEPDDTDLGDGSDEEIVNSPMSDEQEETGTQLIEDVTKSSAKGMVDSASTRSQIIRWAMLQDHWYQHNLEYLSGRFDMRGAPEIRVGYRLDVQERNMSFYVEGVNHSWQFPNSMQTNLQVSRGQPNNPLPLYVFPAFSQLGSTSSQRKTSRSRLATYFVTPDPIAIRRSLFIHGNRAKEAGLYINEAHTSGFGILGVNGTDRIEDIEYNTESRLSKRYDEIVVPADGRATPDDSADDAPPGNEEAQDNTSSASMTNTVGSGIPKVKKLSRFRR